MPKPHGVATEAALGFEPNLCERNPQPTHREVPMKLNPPEIKSIRRTCLLCQLSYAAEAAMGLEPTTRPLTWEELLVHAPGR